MKKVAEVVSVIILISVLLPKMGSAAPPSGVPEIPNDFLSLVLLGVAGIGFWIRSVIKK